MNPSPCQALDDYLVRDLGGDDLARFTAHLAGCPDCRQAVHEQQRLAALLAEAVSREPVPAGLAGRVAARLRSARRRRAAVAAALLAAATATAVWLYGRPEPPREEL